MIDTAKFLEIINSKNDESWKRYNDGWPELLDRYNVTAALVRGPEVLDIGCGEGLLSYLLIARNAGVARIAGIDASPEMIRRAEIIKSKLVEFRQGLAESLPYKNAEFDTVVLGQVLEHVNDPVSVATETIRVLKQGGRLIVNVPADERAPHGNHLRVFKSVVEMCQLFGLAIDWTGDGRLHRYWFAWGEKK